MKTKNKIVCLKALIFIMGILIISMCINLFLPIKEKEQVAQRYEVEVVALTDENREQIQSPIPSVTEVPLVESASPEPTLTPFKLTNFDKIRVLITNKETGGIYHKDKEEWMERNDYRGVIELFEEENGIIVINELSIEEYLYSVVPSEMPAYYPLEALKAQAICARTYAYLHIMTPGYPKWNAHVDDTTAFQVYHSVQEQAQTTRAVNETEGKVLLAPDKNSLAQTYYYSTSCGYGSDARVWKTKYSNCYPYVKSYHINSCDKNAGILTEDAFESHIKSVNETDYESNEAWYRWTYKVSKIDNSHMLDKLQERYKANCDLILTLVGDDFISQPIKKLGKIYDMKIIKRGAGGVADELLICAKEGTYKVITELNIRYVLNDGSSKVIRKDGTKVSMPQLLPSAFFVMDPIKKEDIIIGYEISGGGFGHGAGMSQNAAKIMADSGMCAEDILMFFYEDCAISKK